MYISYNTKYEIENNNKTDMVLGSKVKNYFLNNLENYKLH